MIFFAAFLVEIAFLQGLELSQFPSIPSSETAALQQLYDATGGPQWTVFAVPWNFTGPHNPCVEAWEGVECTCMGTDYPQVLPSYYYFPYYYDDGTGAEGTSCHISKLSLGFSNLAGTIPSSLGSHLLFLTRLHLEVNLLTGSMPSTFGLLSSLQYLVLSFNSLTGVIPTSLGYATALQEILIIGTSVSGSLPSSLGLLSQLILGWFENSLFTGPIPSSICSLPALLLLYLTNNHFSSSIPFELGHASSLAYISFGDNALTGSLPSSLGNLTDVYLLDMNENFLTGSLPPSMGSLQQMSILVLYQNLLSGEIPFQFGDLTSLTYVALYENALSGSIPSTLGALVSVTDLWLYSNRMTGKIPPTLRNITALQVLLLRDNHFSGNLDNVVDPVAQQQFQVLDVSSNQLTGALPTALFQLKVIYSVAMIGNCFTGTLPSEICSATTLQVLALDGLHTDASCQAHFDAFSISYTLQSSKAIRGTIPACLYSMPNLTTLHLTGNGLTGSIADTIAPTSHFVNLSLSNNILTGPIPQWVQSHQWTRLNLGYNRLFGSLSSSMQVGPNSSLALDVNRLSGEIPSSLVNAPSIAILEGNLFACDVNRQSLPVNDPNAQSFQCGSDDLNISLIGWSVAVVSFSLVLVIIMRLSGSPSTAVFFKDYPTCAKLFDVGMLASLSEVITEDKPQFGAALGISRAFVCLIVGLICFVLMPTYAALSVYYKNHVNLYTWAVSVPFLSGATPAVVVIVLWTVVSAVLCVVVADYTASLPKSTSSTNRDATHKRVNLSKLCRRVLMWGALVMADIIIMGGLNAAYVLAVTSGYTTLFHSASSLEIVLGFVKSFWNALVLPQAFKLVFGWEQMLVDQAVDGHERGRDLAWLICEWVVIANNIVLPCIVVALVDPNCFLQVLVPAANIDASYSYVYCTVYDLLTSTCLSFNQVEVNLSYLPPFIYNYQCSSALLTNYAAVFAYVIAFSSFVSPFVGWLYYGDELAVKFRPEQFTIQLVNLCAILLTFGVVFPPLALMALVAAFVETYWAQALMLKAVKMAANEVERHQRKIMMTESTELMKEMLLSSVWLLLPLSAIFNAFFAFDVIGDHLGWRLALGGLFAVTVGLPLVLAAIFVMRRRAVAEYGATPLLWLTAIKFPPLDSPSASGAELGAGDHGFPITVGRAISDPVIGVEAGEGDREEALNVSFTTGSGKTHVMRDISEVDTSVAAREPPRDDDDSVFNATFV